MSVVTQPIAPENAKALAQALTKTQRVAIVEAQRMFLEDSYILRYRNWRSFSGLIKKGLQVVGPSQRLTPLGLMVRQHLIEQDGQ